MLIHMIANPWALAMMSALVRGNGGRPVPHEGTLGQGTLPLESEGAEPEVHRGPELCGKLSEPISCRYLR